MIIITSVMKREASFLVGVQDFSSFCAADNGSNGRALRKAEKECAENSAKSNDDNKDDCYNGDKGDDDSRVREILSVDIRKDSQGTVVIDIKGRSFLYKMVRIIVGTLVDLGLGRQRTSIKQILQARSRGAASETAPALGLCLMAVDYDN